MCFGDEDCRDKVPFSLHIKSPYCQHDLLLLIFTFITWLRLCLSCFSTQRIFFFFSFHIVLFDYYVQPTLKRWRIMTHQIEGWWNIYINNLELFCMSLFVSSSIYYLFNHLCKYGILGIYFILWFIERIIFILI